MALEPEHTDLESYFASFDSNFLEGDAFLNTLTASLHDPTARWSLDEIVRYTAAHEEIELNALDLLPLLWTHFDKGDHILHLLKLVCQRASSKEALIGLLEVQEILTAQLSEWDEDDEENTAGVRFCVLLDLYYEVVPRITLRKKDPLDTLRPVMKGLAQCMQLASPKINRSTGKTLLQTLAVLISSVSSWIRVAPSKEPTESDACNDLLTTLLLSGVASLGKHIHAHLAEAFIEAHYPRKYLHSAVTPESSADRAIMTKVIEAANAIGITRTSLFKLGTSSSSPSIIFPCFVLLAHWDPPLKPTTLPKLLIHLAVLVMDAGTVLDETLFLLLRYADAVLNGSIVAERGELDSVLEPLITLCATNPDPTIRNTGFILFSQLLKTLPPPTQLGIFSELLSPDLDPFPQMRVAAVGLVKDSVLAALEATMAGGEESRDGEPLGKVNVLASPQLLAQLGRYILRSDPPDLLSQSPEKFDVDAFVESSEPVRLTECLGLYYALLVRDVTNKTGIRDRATVCETERYLLSPLSGVLDMLQRQSDEKGDDTHFMLIVSLRMALERVHEALRALFPESTDMRGM